tara:strand:+ start:388 stop:1026 length:639 start_codon:yes stop_codon:yes gene_type:complete
MIDINKEKFTGIFENNGWGSIESKSGKGSELQFTNTLREELPHLFKKYNIKSILDIPCGDFNWMKNTQLKSIKYKGADIIDKLIIQNKLNYPGIQFEVLDIIKDKLPNVDLVFVRDCLVHLSDNNIFKALDNIQRSGSRYLLSTSFTKYTFNPNIQEGKWKSINLMIEPYFLKPIYLINENCGEDYPKWDDKCMVLFDLKDLYCGGININNK